MTPRLVRAVAGLRARIALLLVGGLLVAACGFYGLLDFLARGWARRELLDESQAMIERLALDVTTPLLLGDKSELQQIASRESRDTDVVGAAVLRPDGTEVVTRLNQPGLWLRLPAGDIASRGLRTITTHERVAGVDVYSLLAPVLRQRPAPGPLAEEMFSGRGTADAPGAHPELIGWVRIAYSTARLEGDLTTARQLGLLFLCLVIVLGLVGALTLLRVVVRPLREASDLAREIAQGNLTRRLPVRAGDELGTLAESMNSMATALTESRGREEVEAAALRETAEAVVAIAHGARAARDPASVFRVVAAQLRRVTNCDCVALAVPELRTQKLHFAHFDPAPPWGGIFRGAELDAPLAAALSGVDPPPLRLQTGAHTLPLAATLAGRGFGAALLVPLALEGGPPAALLLVSRDPSAFRPAELRVAAGLASHLAAALHAAQLHDRLETAFDDLHRTQEQLVRSERLRVAGELATGIAHEFNNVLAAILGRVQLLRLRAGDGALSTQELQEAFGVMELAARDGAETVRRLRQFGKGEVTGATESVDLDAVIREAAEFTRPRWKNAAEGGGVHIEVSVESSPGAWVRGNASQLREVFTNLILNAVDALPRGGTVRLGTRVPDGSVIATVEDDGVGMTPDTLKRVYEPFFTTKGARGTGLGLSVVYGIVQRHGGKLAVQSHPGRGTRIELSFPRAAAAEPPPSANAPAPVESLSVMVVDDEPEVRALLVDILVALGHRAVGHGSGESALEGFQPGRFDLVLTDLGMPGINGWQLSQALRAKDDAVTIAFVTGWGEEVDPEQVRRAGADAVVAKPFAIEDIARVALAAADRLRTRAA
jgi:signal transduction histidine kinase/CheY-like chemotaxis protein